LRYVCSALGVPKRLIADDIIPYQSFRLVYASGYALSWRHFCFHSTKWLDHLQEMLDSPRKIVLYDCNRYPIPISLIPCFSWGIIEQTPALLTIRVLGSKTLYVYTLKEALQALIGVKSDPTENGKN